MQRTDVYRLVDGEREYQEGLNPLHLSIGEEIALMLKYVDNALDEWSNDFNPPETQALAMIRKVTSIGVRCMEHHGAPPRE